MSISVVYSNKKNSKAAIREVVQKTKTNIGGRVTFALVFAAELFPAEFIGELKMVLNAQSLICGMSSGIFHNREISRHGIVLVCFDEEGPAGFRTHPLIQERSRVELEKELRAITFKKYSQTGSVLGFLPRSFPAESFIGAVGNIFSTRFPAAAVFSHHSQRRFTAVFDEETVTEAVVGAFIGSSQLSVGLCSVHGFKPIGIPFQFRKVFDERVFDLVSGEPAYHMYQYYFQEKLKVIEHSPEELRRFFNIYPLGFKTSFGNYIISVPEKVMVDGSLILRGLAFSDRLVRLMFSTPTITLESTQQLVSSLKKKVKNIFLAVVIESIHRLRILYPDVDKELTMIQDSFGTDVPIVGMTSEYQVCSQEGEESFRHHIINSGLTVMVFGTN